MGDYPRDLVGYGQAVPHAAWPGGARVAVQFVLNYEEGGENSVLHGDPASEIFLSEIIGATPFEGARHMSMDRSMNMARAPVSGGFLICFARARCRSRCLPSPWRCSGIRR